MRRVYEKPEKTGGTRILIDRLWPRGVSKQKAKIDLWLKDVAPSDNLRKWFNHDDNKWETFRKKYFKELDKNKEAVETVKKEAAKNSVTLVFGAKNVNHNNAVALKEYLEK